MIQRIKPGLYQVWHGSFEVPVGDPQFGVKQVQLHRTEGAETEGPSMTEVGLELRSSSTGGVAHCLLDHSVVTKNRFLDPITPEIPKNL